ncbi:MAG: M24 family metallopeptidase [Candidatus Bathyarchaeia archaeon]
MSKSVDFCRKRMSHLREKMEEEHLDLVLLFNKGGNGQLYQRIVDTSTGRALMLPLDGEPVLFCHSVNYVSTMEESWMEVIELESREKAREQLSRFANKHLESGSSIGVNMGSLSHRDYQHYQEAMRGDLIDISESIIPDVFYGLYPEEVIYQREVSRLADLAVEAAKEAMAPGVKEHVVAAEANYAMMKEGAEMQSFPTIISSGERSAYCHGWPGERELQDGDLVIVDLGPMIHGYAADETRTILLGDDERKERMLKAVDRSVKAVIEEVSPGVSCRKLDSISRRVLKEEGFPDYPHSLGHPISGFVVPRLAVNSDHTLKEGMVFTVEPGIYIQGYGGVRIEENLVITEDSYEKLTQTPRILT